MKNTLRQIFHSPKFVVGFGIFVFILLIMLIYPMFNPGNPLEMIGVGTFASPGTYVSLYDAVGTDTETLRLSDADDNRIAKALSAEDRVAMVEWFTAMGIDVSGLDINDTDALVDLWNDNYEVTAKPAGMTMAKRNYYKRLNNALLELRSADVRIIADENDEGDLEKVNSISKTDYVNIRAVANVKTLPLGTDNFGRDVLKELVSACGTSIRIGLIAGALFGGSGLVAASAYFIGVAAIVISGIILKKTRMFAGDPAPFVMELPTYHIPSVGNVLRATWERGWSFIKRAGTVILASSIILWFLQGFGWENGAFGLVEDMNNSVLAAIGSAVAFIFAPLGFGNWRATVAVVTGLIAKENVVATFGVLYNFAGELSENGDEIWALVAQDYTAISAYSFMIFNLLCAPCFAAMGAIKREMNNAKWTAFAIGYMCVFAYVVSLIVYQIGGLITGEVSFGIGTVVAVVLVVGIVYLLFRKNKYEDERLTIRSVDAAGRRAALK